MHYKIEHLLKLQHLYLKMMHIFICTMKKKKLSTSKSIAFKPRLHKNVVDNVMGSTLLVCNLK